MKIDLGPTDEEHFFELKKKIKQVMLVHTLIQ